MRPSVSSSARAARTAGAAKPLQPAAADCSGPETRRVQGRLLEVLPGHGLAHFEAEDGCIYGVSRTTPGIDFAELREGRLVRCTVTAQPVRVLAASLVA